jgi:hypothetical protein
MAWPGLFSFGGTEVLNASRVEAYAKHFGLSWFKPVYNETGLAWLVGDSEYASPLQDDAPWTDPGILNSYDFYGVYPLEVTGFESSTVAASVVESVVDGGYIGRVRRATRPIVFNTVLVGASECAVEYGMRWLRAVLNGGPCFGQVYGTCGGADLCYLSCAPVFGDPPPTFSKGPIVLDETNLAFNPNLEAGLSAWNSNDDSRWTLGLDTTRPISGIQSATFAVARPNLVTGGANGTFEGGVITGFVGSGGAGSEATVAASTAQAHSGTGSLRVTFGSGAAQASAAYYQVTGLTVGYAYTVECWMYVPGAPNLITQGANGTFEGGVITGWAGIGAAPPTLTASTPGHSGSNSMLVTWATAGSYEAGVQTTTGITTVVGQQYTAEAWLYIPTGSAQASLVVAEGAFAGNIVTVKNQWALSTVTFTATATTTYVAVSNRADTTAGQLCYIDDVRLFSVAANSIAAKPIIQVDSAPIQGPAVPVTTPDTWVKTSRTFTAAATSHYIYLPITTGATTAGMLCYVDDVKVWVNTNEYIVASAYLTQTPAQAYPAVSAEPFTFGIDVRTDKANRYASGYVSFVNSSFASVGVSPTVNLDLTSGEVARFTMTTTPPAGAAWAYPVIGVASLVDLPLAGEKTWFDNLTVVHGTDGSYFDGSKRQNGDYTYRWTDTINASTSERMVQTYVQDPEPTAEDCYQQVARSMHAVTTTLGPSVTAKMTMQDGGAAWSVTWTMVAANPAEFGSEYPLIQGFLDPEVEMPYVGGLPPGASFDPDGFVQNDDPCPVPAFQPVFDPTCALLTPPPDVPSVVPMCFTFPINYLRRSFTIPEESIPLWMEVVPVISLHTDNDEARSVRLRFYADTFGTGTPDADPCNFCGDVVFSYIPPHSTLVLDGTDKIAYIDSPGMPRRRADSLVSDSDGNPFEWPQFSCGFGYVVTVDTPQQGAVAPAVDLSLVPRVI